MCGIAGILRRSAAQSGSSIGQDLMTMASCIQHRGSDSAGFAVFANPERPRFLEVTLPAGAALPEPQTIQALAEGELSNLSPMRGGFSATLTHPELALDAFTGLVKRLEAGLGGAVVTASGTALSIRKTVGLASELNETVSAMAGSHGICHLRLATESRIDPAHAQPFWGRPFPDIAVTHNGHITNYHKLRQQFEEEGYSFASANDSEIIGVYLGIQMANGASLKEALQTAVRELDGSFSFIVATAAGLGVARDFFATKPLLFVEGDDFVALASEQQALRRLLGDDVKVHEIQPKETRTWETL